MTRLLGYNHGDMDPVPATPTRLGPVSPTTFTGNETNALKLGPATETADKLGMKGNNPMSVPVFVALVAEGATAPTAAAIRAGAWDEFVMPNGTWYSTTANMDAYAIPRDANVAGTINARELLR